MGQSTHILVVEDEPADFELIQHELKRSGLECTTTRVDADDALFRELYEHPPEVILSDNALANADTFTILKLVRDRCPDTPVIIVTGGMTEDMLAEVFARGADDCVFKHRLAELAPAVRRALRLASERRRLRFAEVERDQLRREVAMLRGQRLAFGPLITLCRSCKSVRDERGEWEPLEKHFQRQYGLTFTHELCPDCVEMYYAARV